jgi:TPR repeat protein
MGRRKGTDFEDRPPLPDDWTRAHVDALRAAAKRDDASALAQLGDMYSDGWRRSDGTVLVRRDRKAAKRCLERAAALGDAEAMCVLAGLLTEGRVDARTFKRAVELYRRAFHGGYSTAAYNLAVTYKKRQRHRDAFRWFQRAHDAGDPSALLQLARAQLYGIGTKRDPSGALAKLRRMANSRTKYWPASTGENVEAMLIIADALMEGWLLPRDFNEGLRWLRRAASWGNATAIALLRA